MKILSDDEIQKVRDGPEPRLYSTKLLEAQHKDTLRQARDLLDGIENPFPKEDRIYGEEGYSHTENNDAHIGFNEAIQTMKALLEE